MRGTEGLSEAARYNRTQMELGERGGMRGISSQSPACAWGSKHLYCHSCSSGDSHLRVLSHLTPLWWEHVRSRGTSWAEKPACSSVRCSGQPGAMGTGEEQVVHIPSSRLRQLLCCLL